MNDDEPNAVVSALGNGHAQGGAGGARDIGARAQECSQPVLVYRCQRTSVQNAHDTQKGRAGRDKKTT